MKINVKCLRNLVKDANTVLGKQQILNKMFLNQGTYIDSQYIKS